VPITAPHDALFSVSFVESSHSELNFQRRLSETVGGNATAGSPGWLLRAAVASCDATLLTMRAARLGLNLESVEVRVEALSDGRGIFLDEGVSPGSTQMRICFKIKAPGVSADEIQDLVQWVSEHAPVRNDFAQAVYVQIVIENQ
jgi:uncharacterized OsmC-like protein